MDVTNSFPKENIKITTTRKRNLYSAMSAAFDPSLSDGYFFQMEISYSLIIFLLDSINGQWLEFVEFAFRYPKVT